MLPGCDFAPRCARRGGREVCLANRPALEATGTNHLVACHFAEETAAVHTDDPAKAAAGQTLIASGSEPILSARGIVKTFPVRRRGLLRASKVHAVNDVSFELLRGETLGIVGESGSGKSTLAKLVLRLSDADEGILEFEGKDITRLGHKDLMRVRTRMQVMFQDSRAAFNPRMTVESIIAEPLIVAGQWDDSGPARVRAIMQKVGLGPHQAKRYPHEFSGGQQQRIGMARALILNPAFLVLDEPTASLDVSIRAQIVNLLQSLQRELGLSYLFIAHDMSIVHYISDRIAVMYLGRIVEIGDADAVCRQPLHPYTRSLLDSIPEPDIELAESTARIEVRGDAPDPINPPPGCPFHTRCARAVEMGAKAGTETAIVGGKPVPRVCCSVRPQLSAQRSEQSSACHFPLGIN